MRHHLGSVGARYLLVTDTGGVLVDVAHRQRRVQSQKLRPIDAQRSLDRVRWLNHATAHVGMAGHGSTSMRVPIALPM